MPTNDGFDPADPLPRFLAERAEQDIDDELDEAAPRSGIFKASILIVAATAVGIAVLAAGDPLALFGWGSQSPSTPTGQSAADQVVPPAAKDAPPRNEMAASEPAGKDATQNSRLPSDTLRQFQTWAAAREAQARGEPAQPVQEAPAQAEDAPAQNAPASAAEDVQAPSRVASKRRQARSLRNARAEMRMQSYRKARRAERARAERPPAQAERPPAQDARAQDTSAQNAPPLPYYFGLFKN